ncbi:hypothetical protein ISCGN_003781 [Ixodes scapularis]
MPSYGSYCCVAWCSNNGRTCKKPGTKFFRVPRDSRSKAWVEYAKRHDLMDKPAARLYASYYVCSDHFTVHDFMDPGRTRLTKTAVPSVRPQEHWQSVICRDLVEASTSHGTPSDSQPVTLSRAAHDLAEASTSHGTPSDSQPVTLSRAAHDLAEASTSHGTPSDSQPVTLSRAAHDLAEASTSHGTPSDSQPVTLSRAAHDLAEASTSHGTPSDSQPVTLSRAAHDLAEASTSHGTPSDSQPVTLSRAAHDLAEASTSHGTPSDSQPVTLSRAAHDLAEASTSHGTPSDSQPVTLSRAAHDLAEASTSHGTPSDSQPVTLSRAAHDLAEASTSHGTPSDSQPVTLSRAAHDLAEASTSHGTPSDSQPVTLSRAVHDLAEASTSHGTPSDSQPVTLSRAAHDLAEASTSHGTPSDSQPVTLSRAAHDLVQASSSYGTPSDLSPVTPFSSASSESAEACVMSSISTKTQSWNERDRVCTLIFDEMVLKKNLAYDVTQDVVQGFTDDGIERTSTIADRALVVLLSGISKSTSEASGRPYKQWLQRNYKAVFADIERRTTVDSYLGAPIGERWPTVEKWRQKANAIQAKLSPWFGRRLSNFNRSYVCNSISYPAVLYWTQAAVCPESAANRIHRSWASFIWRSTMERTWCSNLFLSSVVGGLGLVNVVLKLHVQNFVLFRDRRDPLFLSALHHLGNPYLGRWMVSTTGRTTRGAGLRFYAEIAASVEFFQVYFSSEYLLAASRKTLYWDTLAIVLPVPLYKMKPVPLSAAGLFKRVRRFLVPAPTKDFFVPHHLEVLPVKVWLDARGVFDP